MTRARVPETEVGIQGGVTVETYDRMQRRLRDKGWIETGDIIKSGLSSGLALEIGPGPGYLGLEWLKNTEGTTLKALEISNDMIAIAERNAKLYGFSARATYIQGTGAKLPFEEETFDGVFTASSLHEWSDPRSTFLEIWRVLKPGGRLMISDFRRDMSPLVKGFLWLVAKPKEMRPGLFSSIHAAYTPAEIRSVLPERMQSSCNVVGGPMGLKIAGVKNAVA
jgi:ubiquinone/menaquinone biosynthesis C-methylase UbiE